MHQHPRITIVEAASTELGERLRTFQTGRDLTHIEMTVLTAMYLANLALIGQEEPPTLVYRPGYNELVVVAAEVQARHQLTDTEMMLIVAEQQDLVCIRALRDERHPDDPGASVDQAPRPPIPERAYVGDIISENARGIPPNVAEFRDTEGDEWRRPVGDERYARQGADDIDRSQEYDWISVGGGGWTTDDGALDYAPLIVTKIAAVVPA